MRMKLGELQAQPARDSNMLVKNVHALISCSFSSLIFAALGASSLGAETWIQFVLVSCRCLVRVPDIAKLKDRIRTAIWPSWTSSGLFPRCFLRPGFDKG